MWLLAAVYVSALAVHAVGWGPAWDGWFGTFVNGWLGLATAWAPAAVCWLAAYRVGTRRPEALLATAAVTWIAGGNTFFVLLAVDDGGSLPFPSPVDVGYLLVYPLLLAVLAVQVGRHARDLAASVWLDCAVGSLGAGAVLAVVMRPILELAREGLSPSAAAVALTSLVFEVVFLAAIAGIATFQAEWLGGRWPLLGLGLAIFTAADVIYGLQATAGTYVLGTPLDAGWAIGLALIAMWVDGVGRHDRIDLPVPPTLRRPKVMAVSSVATVAGVGVLVFSSRVHVPALALVLATGAVLAAVTRSLLAARLLERMAEEHRVAAATDELTGLPNRQALYAEGGRLADPACRRQALLMLDLDGFKDVNDSLGHRAGDLVLIQVGARLREHLSGDDLLVRLGGDEFAVLLDDAGHDEAVHAAARLSAAVEEPLIVENTPLSIGVSIGIALFPDDGPDLSVLLRKADVAMYKAKTSPLALHAYSAVDDAESAEIQQTVNELRTALADGQFVLHYQPKVDLDTGEVNSVEALVRWNHPTRGLLYPGAFLDLVEESGLMPTLTRVVLAQALDQVVDWHRAGHPLTVAVNIPASSLIDAEFPGRVAAMLADSGVPPSSLQLEIAEGFLAVNRELALGVLTSLSNTGVTISVDDFGTGHSSPTYLRGLPIDEIKLDNSLVIPIGHDARAAAAVASAIELAHSMGLRIVAEGVETAGAYTELTRMGCDQTQGYFLSRPVAAAELTSWLSHWLALEKPAHVPQLLGPAR